LPLTPNAPFYIPLNRDTRELNQGLHDKPGPLPGTGGHVLHYSLPWGHSPLSITFSRIGYQQVVIGTNQRDVCRGTSSNGELKLTRMRWCDAEYQFSGFAKLFGRFTAGFYVSYSQ
jgi:hemolysin activation/secretion protein